MGLLCGVSGPLAFVWFHDSSCPQVCLSVTTLEAALCNVHKSLSFEIVRQNTVLKIQKQLTTNIPKQDLVIKTTSHYITAYKLQHYFN